MYNGIASHCTCKFVFLKLLLRKVFLPIRVSVHASHKLGSRSVPELDLAQAISHSQNIALFDPRHRADIFLFSFTLA